MGERETQRFAAAVRGIAETVELTGDPDAGAVLFSPDAEPRGSIVFVHGGGNDRFFGLHYPARRLLEAGYEVLTAHLAGHGRSGSDAFTLNNARTRLDALVGRARTRAHGPVVVLGQSVGGSLALDQLVRGETGDAVVAVSAPSTLPDEFRLAMELGCLIRTGIYRHLRYSGPWGALPAYGRFKRASFPVRTEPGVHYISEFVKALNEMALLDRLEETGTGRPVLVIHGARDGVVPCGQAGELAAAIGPTAQLSLEPRVHHLDPLLNRRVVARLIHWLKQRTSEAAAARGHAIDGD